MREDKTFVGGISTPDNSRHFVTSLARGLELLQAFRPGEGPLGNNELAKRTKLPRSTVSRLTSTLLQLGFLTYRKSAGKYEPSPAVLSLGYTYLANNKLRLLSRPLMHDLAKQVGLGVALATRVKLNMMYVETVRGGDESTLRLEVGSFLPIATTSVGRAFLCKLPEGEKNFLLDHVRRKFAEEWPKVKKGFEQAEKDFADFGYCLSIGDWRASFNAVGAAALDNSTGDIVAFNCGGSAYLVTEAALREDVGPRLVGLSRSVEAMCGMN
ncbi:IclR family transcriptional regulator [Sneathiella sp. HT1-7]|jgi:DNA-binding IclR family transcriptional regulator|uniref:IclR family transcriptional regulator n=1 Tax=Sneathiella sp. HT1-7 TaxID=2887192 RepID=UPI001D159303|nr:IclR family transcriptional regulator [Sneathiella sp. HT1-7]MCC3304384.1 IclR family transcriptional regulator [Sneathiella sp. HT1-7]